MKLEISRQKLHLENLVKLKRERGFWHSEETKKKMSESAKGRVPTDTFGANFIRYKKQYVQV